MSFQATDRKPMYVVTKVRRTAVPSLVAMTLTARELRPDLPIIARSEQSAPMRELRQAGASHVVSPFRSGGAEVVGQILGPNPEDRGRRAFENEGDLIWAEVRVEEGAPLAGVSLESYGRRDDARVSFVALERPAKDRLIAPRGSEILLPGDVLVVAGHPEDVAAMCERARTQPD